MLYSELLAEINTPIRNLAAQSNLPIDTRLALLECAKAELLIQIQTLKKAVLLKEPNEEQTL